MQLTSVERFDRQRPSRYTNRMAIQFNCPGCRQPVEVDDEWAGQHVACPFCQRVVTAPNESTIRTLQHGVPPTGRKLSPTGPDGVIALDLAAEPRFNRLAVVGFGLSLAAILLLILSGILLRFLFDHIEPNMPPQEIKKKMMELSNDPEFAGRILLGVASSCLSFACWLAGAIISVIAVTRKDLPGRRLAIVGLACSGLCLLLFCSGSSF